MSDPTGPIVRTLQFYRTADYDCSYLPSRRARSVVAAPAHLVDTRAYSKLVQQGYRRSGNFTYRPDCDACQACLPIRIDVNQFQLRRTQRRIWRRHQGLAARTCPLAWKNEHYDLYQRYQQARHPGAGMDVDTETQYRQFLLTSAVESRLVEFRDASGQVRMVSLIDLLDHGLSAVYTFFDPDAAGSLGVYGILWQIQQCQHQGLPWLYLGYWVQQSQKMSYKSQFRPFQILSNGQWHDVAAHVT